MNVLQISYMVILIVIGNFEAVDLSNYEGRLAWMIGNNPNFGKPMFLYSLLWCNFTTFNHLFSQHEWILVIPFVPLKSDVSTIMVYFLTSNLITIFTNCVKWTLLPYAVSLVWFINVVSFELSQRELTQKLDFDGHEKEIIWVIVNFSSA